MQQRVFGTRWYELERGTGWSGPALDGNYKEACFAPFSRPHGARVTSSSDAVGWMATQASRSAFVQPICLEIYRGEGREGRKKRGRERGERGHGFRLRRKVKTKPKTSVRLCCSRKKAASICAREPLIPPPPPLPPLRPTPLRHPSPPHPTLPPPTLKAPAFYPSGGDNIQHKQPTYPNPKSTHLHGNAEALHHLVGTHANDVDADHLLVISRHHHLHCRLLFILRSHLREGGAGGRGEEERGGCTGGGASTDEERALGLRFIETFDTRSNTRARSL